MKLIVGLGNVGDRYEKTRHNVGFMIVDELLVQNYKFENRNLSEPEGSPNQRSKQITNSKFEIRNRFHSKVAELGRLILSKPETMMNESGKAVAFLATYYKIHTSDIYIIHDDLDIALGEYKIQKGKGPREHKGLLSIYRELGTKDFWHVRVGVDNRGFANRIVGEDYVLMNFTEQELEVLENVKGKVVDELLEAIAYN